MEKKFALNLAAIGVAAGMILPSSFAAYGRDSETSMLSASQSVDRADAHIADLKAALRLTADQAGYWPRFESAYKKIIIDRAKSSAGQNVLSDRELQTGRTSSDSANSEPEPAVQLEASDNAQDANNPTIKQDRDDLIKERNARNAMSELKTDSTRQADAIDSMQREADALDIRSADLRVISDATRPLYNVLDDHQRQRLIQFIHSDLHENDIDISSGRERR